MNGEVFFYLLLQLLIPYPISHSAVVTRAVPENCLDFDIDALDDYLSALNLTAVPTVEIMTAGFQCPITALPFGALKSDWSRLLLLYEAQAHDSTLKHELRRLFRILVIAFYQMDERFESASGPEVQSGGPVGSTSSLDDATTIGHLNSHRSDAQTTSPNFSEENTMSIKNTYDQTKLSDSTADSTGLFKNNNSSATASTTHIDVSLSHFDPVTDTIYKSTEGTKLEASTVGISSEVSVSWERETIATHPKESFMDAKTNLTNARNPTEDSVEVRVDSTAGVKVYQNTVQPMKNNISAGFQVFVTSPRTTLGDQENSTPRTDIGRGDSAIIYANYGEDEDDSKGQSILEENSTSTIEHIGVTSVYYDDSITSEKNVPSTGESTISSDLWSGIYVGDDIELTTYEIPAESSSSAIIRNNSDSIENIAVTLPTASGETSTQSTDGEALTTINDVNGRFNERVSAGTTLPDSHERTSSFMYPLLNYPDPSLNSVYKIYLDDPPFLDPTLMSAEENGSYQSSQHKIKKPQIVKQPFPENPASKYPLVSRNFVAQTTSTESSLVSGESSTKGGYRTSLPRSQKRESFNIDTENQYRWFFRLAEQQDSGKDKSVDAGIVQCQPEE